jgi:hypothetical protein
LAAAAEALSSSSSKQEREVGCTQAHFCTAITHKLTENKKRAEKKTADLSVVLLRSLSGQAIVERAGHQAALERPERRPNVQKENELDQFVDDPENPRILPGQHRHLRVASHQRTQSKLRNILQVLNPERLTSKM